MSDTNPNTPTVEELTAQVAALREFRASVAKGFGLGDDADDAALLARLTETTNERDSSRAEVSAMKVDSALREAFAKSGATMGHYEDFRNLAAEHFHLDPKTGKVVTKPDAPTPNVDPATWCVVELRQRRPGWWPTSQGGGLSARGTGFSAARGPSDDCFRPGPSFNFTKQLAFEAQHGAAAADAARRKYGGAR
ncbi:MAG: hypothetical protein KF691_07120 [Phycisphaeraceae bacterium]|nr:hypothetical protein [Phycisphaeraceae bacterium]